MRAIDTVTGDAVTIPVEPDAQMFAVFSLAITPDGSFLYVPNQHGDTISVIDTQSQKVVATLPTERPVSVAFAPDGKTAYATAHVPTGYVNVIDTAAKAVVKTVPVEPLPLSIAVSPDGGTAYTWHSRPGTITPIDTATSEAGDPVRVREPVSSWHSFLAITPNQPPIAKLAASRRTVFAGEPAHFNATGSSDDLGIERFEFDFGDGERASRRGGKASHVYSEPGTYRATVTVDDGEGCRPLPQFFDLGLASPFTGQTAHCNGPSRATSKPAVIRVRKARRLRLRMQLERPQRSLGRVEVLAVCKGVPCRAQARGSLRVGRRGAKPRAFCSTGRAGFWRASART